LFLLLSTPPGPAGHPDAARSLCGGGGYVGGGIIIAGLIASVGVYVAGGGTPV